MKKILTIIFLLLSSSTLYAKTIYLNCEEIVQKVREATYEGLYVKGNVIGNNFVKIKSSSAIIHTY